jgi:hypothetical protein
MLSGVFLIVQFAWSFTMYIVWQDAQWNSELVKSGYGLTMLRTAFVISTAARWKSGLEIQELVGADTKCLETSLYGRKRGKMKRRASVAEVDVDIFSGFLRSKRERDVGGLELRKRGSTATEGMAY